MPLDIGSLPVQYSATIVDRERNRRQATAYRNGFATLAEVEAFLAAFEAAIAAITNGYIVGGSISIPLIQTTVPTEPLPPLGSDVQRKGTFVFRKADGTVAKFEVPSLDNTLVNAGGNNLNLSAAPIIAYDAFMRNNAVLGSVGGDGIALTELISARKTHRGDSRG